MFLSVYILPHTNMNTFFCIKFFVHIGSALEQEQDDHHQLPPFCEPQQFHIDDPTIVAKITEFHNELASLEPVRCSTCLERFPSISLNDGDCCKRCHNDNHVPKQFSAANNMDPGSVPPELNVSNIK